jgi:hypothetical protein
MERFSQEWWSKVECVPGCANCCPKTCKHLTSDLLCDVHPKKLGVSVLEALDYGRGLGCHATPIQLFISDVYCPAITNILENEGINIPHHTGSRGVELITDFHRIMELTKEIRGF